jgi:putative ABC transport system substrate-binding protein
MIGRRTFIAGLGSTAAWPLAARAQQRDRMQRIGVLIPGDENASLAKARISAFTQALANLGWTDGRNVRMDVRGAGGDINWLRGLAHELVGLQPDLILTNGTAATTAVQRETRTIPIVFAVASDPVVRASSSGSTARVGTSPASPPSKPRWEASGLSCSPRSRPGSSGP